MATFALGVLANCTMATAGCADRAQELEALGRVLLESLLTIQMSTLRGPGPLSVLLSSIVKMARYTDIAKGAQNTLVSLLPMFPGGSIACVYEELLPICVCVCMCVCVCVCVYVCVCVCVCVCMCVCMYVHVCMCVCMYVHVCMCVCVCVCVCV